MMIEYKIYITRIKFNNYLKILYNLIMKYIIGVIIHNDTQYNHMKDIWIKNMSINGLNNMELYFIYGNDNNKNNKQVERIVGDIYNFYGKNKETLYNILKKTLDFMEYIDNTHTEYVFLRTNASTMFNLPLLKHYMNDFTTFKYAAGGTFTSSTQYFPNGLFEKLNFISGTNLCISQSVVKQCVNARKTIEFYGTSGFLEDVAISKFILHTMKCDKVCFISRIDILDQIELQHYDSAYNVFCFRFKSNNRENDIHNMNYLLNNNFDIKILLEWVKKLGINHYVNEN